MNEPFDKNEQNEQNEQNKPFDKNKQNEQNVQHEQNGANPPFVSNELNVSANEPANVKKTNTLLDVLIGIGLSAVAYFSIWLVTILGIPYIIKLLVYIIVLAAFGFVSVKFLRKGHKPAGATMLIMISPVVLGLLIYGTCAMLFIPY